jgi:AbrB family looped-hinge helix DNA binding protein
MKTTGIVRRVDDLGRVVIPKDIRKTMKIREGDPLEIYTTNDGGVCFKKYSPIGECDWERAVRMAKAILVDKFALLDRDGNVMGSNSSKIVIDSTKPTATIRVDGDEVGYLMALEDNVDFDIFTQVAKGIGAMFAD